MFECRVCGLLSLKGPSCPGCGSQLRTDLSLELDDDEFVPTEVPGLEDAAESWYELEGMDRPKENPASPPASTSSPGSLPFGFQGESNTYQPNLLFGIGSFANGMPFSGPAEPQMAAPASLQTPTMAAPVTTPRAPKMPAPPSVLPSKSREGEMATVPLPNFAPPSSKRAEVAGSVSAPVPLPSPSTPEMEHVPLPVVESPSSAVDDVHEPVGPEDAPLEPLDMPTDASPPTPLTTPLPPPPAPVQTEVSQPVRLEPSRLVEAGQGSFEHLPEPADEAVPDYWRIDAPIPDYTTIYETPEEVVEVVHDVDETDVVVYQHEATQAAAVFKTPLEASQPDQRTSGFRLRLHPAQALAVDVEGEPEHAEWVKEGYAGLASSNWGSAARSFQRLAGQRPQDAAAMNNYGISLLQRAIGMAESSPGDQDATVSAQFESAILALREAAKADPTNGDILVNLAHALIESGRSEKALGIMNVHNQRTPGDAKGMNTQAVALSQLGQMAQAIDVLKSIHGDAVATSNLAQFTG